ncbi:hypothetical protein KCU67_g13034, partial [Aureobasidium melanogenum]
MAENDHIMTTRSKLRSRTGASDDTNTTVLPDVPDSTASTKSTTSTKSKAPSNKTKPTTTSRSAGKKPVYNPDPGSDAEENIIVYEPARKKESVYDPDLGSDAEENIAVLQPAATTKPRASKGKERQRSNTSGTINDDMLALSFKDPMPPSALLTNGKPRTATASKPTPKKATTARNQKTKPQTSEYEFSEPAASLQAPESRAVHPEYPDLPPEVPVDNEGVPTAYFAKIDGKVKVWGKKRGN